MFSVDPKWFPGHRYEFQLVMKHDFNPIKKPSGPAKPPSPGSAARSRCAAIQARRRNKKTGEWQSLVIGGLVIGAVFVGLEVSRQAPEAPVAAVRETTPEPAAKVETSTAPDADEPVIAETANVEPKVAIPLPAETPVPQDAANPQAGEAELLGKEAALVLTDLDSRRENAVLRDKKLFERAIEGKAWNAYRGLLAKSMDAGIVRLAKDQGVNRFDAVWKEPVFYQAFLRWQLLGRLSEQEISEHVTDSYSGEMLTWLCYNTRAMEEFLLTIKPEDDGGKVLKFLIDAWPNTTGKDDQHAETVRLANQLGPSFTETWTALYALLKKQTKLTGDPVKPGNLEEWKSFAKAMRQEFKDNPRMAALAADAEDEYIFPYGDEGDASRALGRERRRIERDSGEQKDLIAESLKREAELIRKRGDATAKKDISNLYDSALRKYGGSITGFKMMADDYFGYLKDDPELARKAARDIELAFKCVVETETKDWFRAKTESLICKMICGYYRAAGDEERAVLLEKRYQVLLKRAERSAL